MHIAFVIPSLGLPGGAERVLVRLANYWAQKQGHHITIITTNPLTLSYTSFYPLDPSIRMQPLSQEIKKKPLLTHRFIKRIKFYLALRKAISNLHPDIVISFLEKVNLYVLLATYNLKIPIIVSERSHPAFNPLPFFNSLSFIYKKLRDFLYSRAVYVVVLTQSAAEYFRNFKNVIIIPNSVPSPPKTLDINLMQKVNHIISIGRLDPSKGFDILLYAFANILKFYPHLTLTIYGEGQERSKLEQLIQSLNLTGKVLLPGNTKNIYEVLLQAQLFIFPTYYEGFPNALAEAMSVGLPVIASNCPGNRDIIRDGIDGRLFPVGDIDTLTKIAKELIPDIGQRIKLSNNAKTIVEHFSPEHIFSLWDKALSDSISKSSRKN